MGFMEGACEGRHWKLRTNVSQNEAEIQELISDLQKETGLSPITLRVCILRGLTTIQAIQEYLSPRFENLTSPWVIRDMDRAIERLSKARQTQERIRIFGDYDVDGTTGAALLTWVFRDFGFSADARQPDRFKDGYGLNVRAVEDAVKDGIQVLVTVDCGISSFDAAQRAKDLGLDLIVVDHHQIDVTKGLPAAYAVVNPQRADCESGLKQLCGCGLAFYVAIALRGQGRKEGWFPPGSEPNLKQHLDLVVMATAADMVPLTGDNHILVRYGLEVLKYSKKPGVKALLEAAGLGSKDLSPSHLGFVLGPRINASGRMHSASLALELLTTTEMDRAHELALELERLNQERALLQNQIWDEVRLRVEKGIAEGKYRYGIAVADSKWHEGVVGIVASRVTETFRKPAAVIALREDFGKGSVRSYGGKNVLSALRECSSLLLGFGGHKHAAGLSVSLQQVDEFADAFDRALEVIQEEGTGGSLLIEGDCSIDELNVRSLQELERLGPFGPGNPEPVFTVRASIKNHRVLKGRHLKLNLGPVSSSSIFKKSEIEAIWFHGAERRDFMIEELKDQEQEWAGVPELNRFRGQMTPTFRVRDWRRIGSLNG
jgi:single-stranded-DNA-specific exonuclease